MLRVATFSMPQNKKPQPVGLGFRCLKPGGVLLYSGHPALRPSGRCTQRSKTLTAVLSHAHARVDTQNRIQIKKPLAFAKGLFGAWRCPTLTWGDPTLPSALTCFTSEFGMDSGGSTSLWPPDKFVNSGKLKKIKKRSKFVQPKSLTSTALSRLVSCSLFLS